VARLLLLTVRDGEALDALHCIASHRIALHCIASHRIALRCVASHRIASHRIALRMSIVHRRCCLALPCLALPCLALTWLGLAWLAATIAQDGEAFGADEFLPLLIFTIIRARAK
jgi:hypothetical protein